MKRSSLYVLVIALFLFLNNFFGAIKIPPVLQFIALLSFLVFGWNRPTKFRVAFVLIIVGFICSAFSCYYYRGQSVIYTAMAMKWYYGIFFYFFLKKQKVPLRVMENIVAILILLFDIAFISQYILLDYGVNFLRIEDWNLGEQESGGNRLRVMSSGLYSLGIFYGLTKYKMTYKSIYFVFIIGGIICLLLSGFRQLLASAVITYVIFAYMMGIKMSFRNLLGAVCLVVAIFLIYNNPEVQIKIQGMAYRNEGQTLNNENYARVLQLKYYLSDHFKSPVEFFLGSGYPHPDSKYGAYLRNHYTFVDWGLLGQIWTLGFISVGGFLFFAIKAIYLKVNKEYCYIAFWYLFLLLSSLTNYEFMRNGNFLLHGAVLYMVELAANEKNFKQMLERGRHDKYKLFKLEGHL